MSAADARRSIVGAGALGAAWFTRPPRRGVVVAPSRARCSVCAVMGARSTGRRTRRSSPRSSAREADDVPRRRHRAIPTGRPSKPSVLGPRRRGSRRAPHAVRGRPATTSLRCGCSRPATASCSPAGSRRSARRRSTIGRAGATRSAGSTTRSVVALSRAARPARGRERDPRRSSCAAPARSPPTPRALVAGFLLGDTRGDPDAGDRRLPRLRVSRTCSRCRARTSRSCWRSPRRCSAGSGSGARTATALAIVLVFAAMTRFEPSVLRASAMAAIALLATLGGRPASSLRVLALRGDRAARSSIRSCCTRSAFALSCGASAGIALLCRGPIGARLPGPRVAPRAAGGLDRRAARRLAGAAVVFGTFPLVTPVSQPASPRPRPRLLGVYGFFASAVAGVAPAARPVLQQPTALLVAWITAVAHAGAASRSSSTPARRASALRLGRWPPRRIGSLPPCPSRRSRPCGSVSARSTCAGGSS